MPIVSAAPHISLDATMVMVPGWMGSGPTHWQTLWEKKNPEYRRVSQRDWRSVHRADWVLALDSALSNLSGDIVLVAHSLGCLSVAAWASGRLPGLRPVVGAMLVAPPDLASAPGHLPALSSFTPVPAGKLPFSSLVVASENDPYATIQAAAAMAENWGSRFVNVGRRGHINVDSGHGNWPEGEQYLRQFLSVLQSSHYGAGRAVAQYAQPMDVNSRLVTRQCRHGARS
jgi:uncharacterized protein